MNLYKHKVSLLLYTIEELILDIKHFNGNAFSGMYAHPYNHNGPILKKLKSDKDFSKERFMSHFNKVAEL